MKPKRRSRNPLTEITNKSQTEIAKESAEFPVTKETEHEKLFNSSILKREFKISGTIGEPGQTEKLSFVSLTHQIDSGIKRGYKETGIVDAVIRSIAPHSSLRSYIETLPDLNLGKLRKILRIHFREKTASELYQNLSITCQKPKEFPQQFLLRALDLSNKVLFTSQESNPQFDYGSQLIQNTYLKAFETGLPDDILATNLRPILRKNDLSDEELMRQVNELNSNQEERLTKIGGDRQKAAIKANFTNFEPSQAKANKTTSREETQPSENLLAEIREIKTQVSELKQYVNRPQNDYRRNHGSSGGPRFSRKSRGRGRGRSQPRSFQSSRLQELPRPGLGDTCRH